MTIKDNEGSCEVHQVTAMPATVRREMTVVEKGIILVLFHLHYSITFISTISGRPWSTIKNFLNRTAKRGTIENAPRSGRPTKLSKRDRRAILRCVKKNKTWTREEIRQQCCPHVSLDTLDRYLRENGLRKWLAKKRPKLTEARAKERLAWALKRQHWTAEDFQSTIWSDECTVERAAHARQIWVFRTPQQKWDKDCIHPVAKGKGISIMVCGCFWGKQRGTFVPLIVHSVNSLLYRRLLKMLLLPVVDHINRTIGNAKFQQDNAPVHTAKIIKHFLQRHNISVDQHPPYSPDLNPIEHAWVHLKRYLQKKYPDISQTPGGPDAVRARLAAVLPEAWEAIPESVFESLWRSMPDRVAAVIAAKGWYTRY